jgi:hypothetical protein
MNNEANLFDSFNRLQDLMSKYLDVYPLLEFSKENSSEVSKFICGMTALQQSFDALLEALKIHSEILGVELKLD